ncbi:MAG TPA: diguanylate cyclase [Tepidisphaeraceae bacterium]|jgi:diguanylate cyclase (GGDEF)-like protein
MSRQKVLVIDDSVLIHNLVRARLEDEPVEMHFADGAAAGLRLAAALSPDLILLDVEMPDANGFDTCRRLKSDPATASTPVIFLTGVSSPEQKVQGLELGAVDYVTKPFDPAELRARVRAALRTKYLMDLLAKRALIDGLTGLWNRTCFEERLVSELSLARRSGDRPLACALIDLDHFKRINDTHGHPFGDEVLRTVGQLLQDCCRIEDVACRYGGEEFVLLLPNTNAERAMEMVERVRNAVAVHPFTCRRAGVSVTCSAGVADNRKGRGGAAMLDLADKALYLAKEQGRNCAVNAHQTSRPAAA